MKPGAIVQLPDGKTVTVVYHHLDGYGVIWGEHKVDPSDLPEPQAMLREPYPGASVACVGGDYKLVRDGRTE